MVQKLVMLIAQNIISWTALPGEDRISREDLLATSIRQMEQRPDDVEMAINCVKKAQLKNKEAFDKKQRLLPKKIEEGN